MPSGLMIPEEKSAAVNNALREAFGVTAFEDIRSLTKGYSKALVFRIVVQGTPFLLRIIMRKDDPSRHFECMRAAADAGLAPRVWHTNVEDKVSITDFVQSAPFPTSDALVRMPAALRTLHALPPFPGVPNHINTTCMFLMHDGPALDGFLQKFQAAQILPRSETQELLALHTQLAAALPRNASDMVSSHNDLKTENVVFDGERVWLVDWEAAFLNDRYNDLAVFANFIVTNDAEEKIYLETYFGQPPDRYQLARYFVMQQIVHLFYTLAYLYLGSAEPVNLSEKVPEFVDFHRRNWAGGIEVEGKEKKTVYGMVHRERLLHNVRQPRFREAMKIVGAL